MDELPVQPGVYSLFLRVISPRMLEVGRFGHFEIPAGLFAYQGSAQGPGGLNARLGRHLRGNEKPHWHIDYLRAGSFVAGYVYFVYKAMDYQYPKLECTWNQVLTELSGASVPVPGFGASDCKAGCLAHLVHISKNPALDNRLSRMLHEKLASVLWNKNDDLCGSKLMFVRINS